MDGVALIVNVLLNDSAVTGLVDAERIMGGVLPIGMGLPAISVTSVSKVDRHPLTKMPTTHVQQRVQVTAYAGTYDEQTALQLQIRKAITALLVPAFWASTPDWYDFLFAPFIHDVTAHSVGSGPDFMNEAASIYIGSDDYRVTYNEER